MKEKLIFHVDVNSAFLSWEAVERIKRNPLAADVRTFPSAIGGDMSQRRGVILAKSLPAKAYGVVTGEPIQTALKKCPDLFLIQPNHQLYSEYSSQMFHLLYQFTPDIEPASIDEAYLDMTEVIRDENPISLASTIKDTIYKNLNFTVNVGISTNKLLAKMASDFKKPNLVHTLFPHEVPKKMWALPLHELFFVGKMSSKVLKDLGLVTIGDVAKTDVRILKAHLGNKYGHMIHEYANGISNDSLVVARPANKGYGNSTTLAEDVTDFDSAKLILLRLCETVGARLRKDKVSCSCVSVEATDWEFKKQSHQTTLTNPTDSSTILYETACSLLKEFWDGTPLRLLGVRTTKLTEDQFLQMNLFDNQKPERLKQLDEALDRIRDKYGNQAIKRASTMPSPQDKN